MEEDSEVTLIPRKRQKRLHLRKRDITKENFERGKEHTTASGRIVAAKKFEGQIICKSGKDCCKQIDIVRQNVIFDSYYNASSWTQNTLLIRSSVKKPPVKHKPMSPIIQLDTRNCNFVYSLEDADGVSREVCRDFYMKCLSITPARIKHAVNTFTKNPSAVESRGRAVSINKTAEKDRQNVIRFINLFPKYESHYSRKTSQKKYLHPNLNFKKLYEEYKSSCNFKKENFVSQYVFSEIFNNNFNLSFKHPHTDTCKTCDILQCSLRGSVEQKEIDELKKKEEKHMKSIESVCNEFKQCVENSTQNRKSAVLTFDLQKTLETPALTTSVAYHKRQLWTYNLCVYDEVDKKGYMYVWNESVTSRGGQEIGSCLISHLKNHIAGSVESIVLYSDSFGGQNRNIKLVLLLKHFLAVSTLKDITQKFFIAFSFSLIEKCKKNMKVVATPDDWINIIKGAKTKDPKFHVQKMKTADFVSSKELEKLIVNRKVDLTGQKINWFKVQKWENIFSLLFFSENLTQSVNLKKHNVTEEQFRTLDLQCLFPDGKAITKAKYLDLVQLMRFIPNENRSFFKNLKYDNMSDIDYGIVSDGSGDEN